MDIADIPADEIARAAQATDFSGVVSVAPLGDGPALELAFGHAERGHRVPNTAATRFGTASGCKAFTATAIGLLIDDGRIGLETRFADCVRPRVFNFAPEITIEQLLSHTSGVPDYFDEDFETDYAALWRDRPCYRMTAPADFLPLFEGRAMKAAPGAGFHYSNSGYVLLGLAIEALTGRDFRDFIGARIFAACGMTRTGYFAMDALPEDTATGYASCGPEGWRSNIFSVPSIGGADGGAFTTADDLRRFWTALLGGRLLKPATVARFITPAVPVPGRAPSWHYGLGLWLRQRHDGWDVCIEGNDPGAALESRVYRRAGLIGTVLSNTEVGTSALAELLDRIIDSARS